MKYKYLIFCCCLIIVFLVYQKTGTLLTSPWEKNIDYSLQVKGRFGKPLNQLTTKQGYWRFPIQVAQVDPQFIQLLIAYEDKNFYQHIGIDFFAILRAIWQLISHGKIVSGASTISMQTIRLLQPAPRTLWNKLYEMLQALRMEQSLTKNGILSLYLNLASYGGNIQGIRAASQLYFNKNPQRLNLSEIALLIALPQSPETRRPDRHHQHAKIARDHVLTRLFSKKNSNSQPLISEKNYHLAINQKVISKRKILPKLAPHLTMQIQKELKKHHKKLPNNTLFTSIDAILQKKVEALLKLKKNSFLKGETLAAMVVDNSSRKIIAYAGSADYYQGWKIDLTRSIRSPGSTLKPFIYGLGFEMNKFHPNTRVIDQPIRIQGYTPQNFNGQYMGEVSIKQALQYSLNIPAVLALNKVGAVNFVQRINKTGINLSLLNNQRPGLPIALGGVGISLYDLVSLYAALATKGEFKPLSYLTHDPKNSTASYQLLTSKANDFICDILKDTPSPNGFINRSKLSQKIHYKTGTSYGYRDTWAIGFNAHYTIGVWSGRPDAAYMQQQTGFNRAAPILFSLFDRTDSLRIRDIHHIAINQLKPLLNQKSQLPQIPQQSQLSHQQLPEYLKWLGLGANHGKNYPLTIRYPVNGSVINIQQNRPMVLKAQGGRKPYQWIINGKLINYATNISHLQWHVPSKGQFNMTVIDASGEQQNSSIWID